MEGLESAGSVRETDFLPLTRFRVGGCARIGYSSDATPERSGGPVREDSGLACGRGSAGRASPCQGEGRGFESRRPLGGAAMRLWLAAGEARSCGGVAEWLRQGPAKPCTRVRFPSPPPFQTFSGLSYRGAMTMSRVRQLRVVVTADDFDQAVA